MATRWMNGTTLNPSTKNAKSFRKFFKKSSTVPHDDELHLEGGLEARLAMVQVPVDSHVALLGWYARLLRVRGEELLKRCPAYRQAGDLRHISAQQ